ncbi:MAG TPA: DUF2784 domain-containing protein [Steroidobacteraceae bacterium]|nr:DUF2784 domain-containing protein [Steroidobacteraceae bacterium]
MIYSLCADLVLTVHFGFVLFVIFGGLLLLRWPKFTAWQLLALAWGALTEFTGWICPLTPLEVALRRHGGQAGYEGGCIDHYISLLLYPPGLTHSIQIWLGCLVLLFNLLIYGYLIVRSRRLRTRLKA